MRDDSVLPVVRVVAGVIVFVLVLAVGILYFMPGETERLWAWTIRPEMTPLLMGAGYAAGAYFFIRVLLARSWRTITLGFLPITAFTSMLLIATLLHWENFNHGHISFYAWLLLYAVTPALVPALWLFNRRSDPGRTADDLMVPLVPRAVLGVAGALITVLALALFIAPEDVAERWPWQLSPLTGRTVAAYLGLTGLSLVLVAWDARWRASRLILETVVIGVALIVVAIVRAWDVLDPSMAVRWSYLAAMVVFLLMLVAVYAWMHTRAAQSTAPTAADAPPLA